MRGFLYDLRWQSLHTSDLCGVSTDGCQLSRLVVVVMVGALQLRQLLCGLGGRGTGRLRAKDVLPRAC